jgi:hypothetical protein
VCPGSAYRRCGCVAPAGTARRFRLAHRSSSPRLGRSASAWVVAAMRGGDEGWRTSGVVMRSARGWVVGDAAGADQGRQFDLARSRSARRVCCRPGGGGGACRRTRVRAAAYAIKAARAAAPDARVSTVVQTASPPCGIRGMTEARGWKLAAFAQVVRSPLYAEVMICKTPPSSCSQQCSRGTGRQRTTTHRPAGARSAHTRRRGALRELVNGRSADGKCDRG